MVQGIAVPNPMQRISLVMPGLTSLRTNT